jgi:hypothetical protein
MRVQPHSVVDNSDYTPTGLTGWETRIILASQELRMLPISSDEDRDVPSYVRVPTHRLPASCSDIAVASGLVPCSAFLLTRRRQVQQAPPAAQTAHPTRLSGLLPFLPQLYIYGSITPAPCGPGARSKAGEELCWLLRISVRKSAA